MDVSRLLIARQLKMTFGRTRALCSVDLSVQSNEILGLIGGNGAGKSTLLKILTGIYKPDQGEMTLDNIPYNPRSPYEAIEHRVVLIPQELRVVPSMSVADNVMLGRWPSKIGLPLVDNSASERLASEWLETLGLDINPKVPIGSLSFAARQSVVIARALGRQARLLILDEPTAALGKAEVDLLFKLIERMRAQGTAIIYVSHRLDEIKLLCDRVVALRDGEVVAELKRGAYTYQDLVLAISGQKIQQMAASIPPPDAPVLLAADAHYNKIDESLSMRAGWVSGLHGLLGSGIENLLRCLFGACDTCQMDTPAGKTLLSNPGAAIRAGIGYVPSERFHAIVPHMSVRDNIVLPHLQHFARIGGTINRRALDAAVAPLMARLGIRPDNPTLAAGSLSGGNQQKLLFARWMMGTTHTLLLDEATHGVDIGAKALIKSQIREFAARGGAVLMHSVEIEDLAELVDELYLMIGNKLSAPQQRPPSGYDLAGLKGQMSLIDPTITHAEHAQ